MAIEPLGSVMSVQAQTQIQTKPVTQTTNAEYTDVSAQETIQQTDPTIRIVENTQKKGDSDAQNGDNANTMKQPSNEQIKKAVEAFNKKFGSRFCRLSGFQTPVPRILRCGKCSGFPYQNNILS